MAYQPNDFVNPHHRGVELPAGCKDLNEFLMKNTGGRKAIARPVFPLRRGSLKDVPKYVQVVYVEHYGLSLAVMVRAANAILWVHNRYDGSRLAFVVRKQHTMLEPIVKNLFGSGGFHEEASQNMKLITGPLPHLWLEAAQIVESVIRGYGAQDNADLLFHLVRRAE
jgi:hypothetical protein